MKHVLTYLLLLALVGTIFMPWLSIPAVIAVACLLLVNWKTYRFFIAKRGCGFALKSIPWHWFYFFYSGLAFVIGVVRFQVKRAGSGAKSYINAGKVD